MSGTETHANSVNVDPDSPHETVTLGKDYSNPIYRQSSPYDDEIAIIKAQIDEDMHDLEIFTARVEAEDVKISKKTQILLELKAELEMLNKKHQETARQLLIERDIENSFESQSREFASRISPSMCAPRLMKIHSSSTGDALSIIRSTMESLHASQEQHFTSISELQSRLRIESTCLLRLSDRKHSLEIICGELRSSMKRKRSVLSSKRLPTEILIQIFDMVVEKVIHSKTLDSNPMGGHPALNMASVCHRWRDTAMETSCLWRYIPIYGELEASTDVPTPIKHLYQRAGQSGGLFLDLTVRAGEDNVAQTQSWSKALGSIAHSWENMKGLTSTILSINHRGKPIFPDIPFKMTHTYTLYNIYPKISPSEAAYVTSLSLHSRPQPSFYRLSNLLLGLQNLTSFELVPQGRFNGVQYVGHPSCPSLERLGVPLSTVPWFFSREGSVSRVLKSLTIHADGPYHSSFLRAETWLFVVESCGLATGLQYLALNGANSLSFTEEFMVPLLWGLKSVVTLALCGPFLGPILHKLSKDQTLLPSLHCLKMCGTDIEWPVIEEFLDSRLDDTAASVPIRELVLDRCNSITRDFCDRMGGKVDKLVIYC